MTGQQSSKTSDVFTLPLLLLAAFGVSSYLLGGYLTGGLGQEGLIDWDIVKSTYIDYLKHPTPDNGKRLLEALPQEKTEDEKGDASGAVDYIHNDYTAFEERVLRGDITLIEAAFRLLNFLDGAFAKEVSETLGDLATRNPWLFLDYLYRYRNSRYVKKAGPPVFGTRHEDKAEDILEWKRRIKALSAVEETRYRQIRDDCIRLLEEAIKKYQPK